MRYIYYNSLSNNRHISPYVLKLEDERNDNTRIFDVIQAKTNFQEVLNFLKPEDEIVLVGGDGTLNFFINSIDEKTIKNKIFYYPAGTGNDFYNDVHDGNEKEEILINDYLFNLPIVEVNGVRKKFLNGIGYGIDGYCCEEGDIQRAKGKKKINYSLIALKGLLFKFKPRTAKVTIDDLSFDFDNVWLAPSMKGRYYGGGMKIAPEQVRNSNELSLVVYHSKSKIKALMNFPSLIKGEHTKKTNVFTFLKGKNIVVTFSKPCALQIDGETILNVSSYKVFY